MNYLAVVFIQNNADSVRNIQNAGNAIEINVAFIFNK